VKLPTQKYISSGFLKKGDGGRVGWGLPTMVRANRERAGKMRGSSSFGGSFTNFETSDIREKERRRADR